MKKFILLCFGLIVAGFAAQALPDDFQKKDPIEHIIKVYEPVLQVNILNKATAREVVTQAEDAQDIFIMPALHNRRTGIEKPMARYLRPWYSSIHKDFRETRPGIENDLSLIKRYS